MNAQEKETLGRLISSLAIMAENELPAGCEAGMGVEWTARWRERAQAALREGRALLLEPRLSTEPFFSSEAQETFSEGSRVFLAADIPVCKKGGEGIYRGHLDERLAVVDLDTPSGEPYRVSVHFDLVRNLYR